MKHALRLASLVIAAGSIACGAPSAPRPAASAAAPARSDALPPGHPPIDSGAAAAPAGDQPRVSGTILLAPKLAAGPSDVLYVMARQGPTTLLVRRIEKPAFPLDFELSDGDAMVSGVPLEGAVDVVARVSRTGDAIPAKGDLEGTTRGVAIPASAVRVTIDSVRP